MPEWPVCVLHKCDNRLCVRFSHLFLGTRLENSHDMLSKGRGANGDRFKNEPPIGEKNPRAKLSNADVVEIRAAYAAGGVTHQILADRFGMSRNTVTNIINWRERKAG